MGTKGGSGRGGRRVASWLLGGMDVPGGKKEQKDLIKVCKISQGKSIIGLQDLFTLDKNNKGTRGRTLKLSTRCSAIAERPRCRVRYSFRQK